MKKISIAVQINAAKEKVWTNLWSDATYRQWTSAFSPGSYAESDWNEGSKIKFLSPNGSGMFGIIEKRRDYETMIFKHLGEIKNGTEETKDWGGATEAYQLNEKNEITELTVQMDSTPEFEDYFLKTFPKALQILKEICES